MLRKKRALSSVSVVNIVVHHPDRKLLFMVIQTNITEFTEQKTHQSRSKDFGKNGFRRRERNINGKGIIRNCFKHLKVAEN